MNLLNRYIFRELIKIYVAVLIVIGMAFVIQRLIFLTEWSMHKGIGMAGVFKMLACLFPGLFLTAVPLVCLFVTIVVMSQLCEENELVVMMSCGRSLGSMAAPVVVFTLISVLLTGYLSFFLVPQAIVRFEMVRWELVQAKSEKALPTQLFVDFGNDSQIYVQRKDEQGLYNLIIYRKGKSDTPFADAKDGENLVFAKQARIQSQAQSSQSILALQNGVFIAHQENPRTDQFTQFENALARIDFGDLDALNKRLGRDAAVSTFPELISKLKKPEDASDLEKDKDIKGLRYKEMLLLEICQRVNQVLACLLLSLWGLGLGVKPPRTSRTASYILGLGAGFTFYYLNVLFKALALKRMMPIELAMFSPSILIFITGGTLVLLRMQGKEPLNFIYQLDENIRYWLNRRAKK
jgi:lipopolysaccharide export system permease protein